MKRFIIDHIDPFGQGVYKKDEHVYFIPKTLPGETGTFEILKKKKGVHFCKLSQVDEISPERINPDCSHFNECNGCHFLHTNYQNELTYKEASFKRLLSNLQTDLPDIQRIESKQRLNYRNRVQLHYNTKQNKLGYKRAQSQSILHALKCQIFDQRLQKQFDWLFQNWKTEVLRQGLPPKGHVEIYLKNNQPQISWNRPYADGGFTQVNEQVNQVMIEKIFQFYRNKTNKILDLFGGQGNLTQGFTDNDCLSIDLYSDQKRNDRFYHLDLFQENALSELVQAKGKEFDTIFLDPPRSGFKQLFQWVEEVKPQNLAYISCHPATMIRDIKPILENYIISDIFLVDLFPATFHYEAMIFFKNRS